VPKEPVQDNVKPSMTTCFFYPVPVPNTAAVGVCTGWGLCGIKSARLLPEPRKLGESPWSAHTHEGTPHEEVFVRCQPSVAALFSSVSAVCK